MIISSQKFIQIYMGFLLIATVERVLITFFKKSKKDGVIYHKWAFTALLYTYLFIVFVSIIEYFTTVRSINLFISIFGLMLYVFGVMIRRFAMQELGDNWSNYIEIKRDHKLIKTGIYKKMNHPYCFAVVLELFGICLIPNAYRSILLVLFLQIPFLLIRIKLEEKVLLNYFKNIT